MSEQEAFGGTWTQDKLTRLREYLTAYRIILRKYPYFQTVYVDAFAGTGVIPQRVAEAVRQEQSPVAEFLSGSARVALEVDPPFGRYLFIERAPKKVPELEALKSEFSHLSSVIDVVCAEANS